MTEDLFQNINGKLLAKDVCARKHGGNPQSVEAFEAIRDTLSANQEWILSIIKKREHGVTVDELSYALDTTPNAISGRITELRMMGKIEKCGTRKTRSGCSAAVWIAK